MVILGNKNSGEFLKKGYSFLLIVVIFGNKFRIFF